METNDKKLCREEEEAKQLLAVTQSQTDKKATAPADNILETIIVDDTSSSGLEDVPESEDNKKEMEPRKQKLQHPDGPTFRIPHKRISEVHANRFEVSKASESDSHFGSNDNTTVQQSSYQVRTAQHHDAPSSQLSHGWK